MNTEHAFEAGGAVAIQPLHRPFQVVVSPPGSKSETNRYLMLGALSVGVSRLEAPLRSDDTDLFMAALAAIGVGVEEGERSVSVHAPIGALRGGAAVNLGDGGTPTRFMMAIASLAEKSVLIDGSARMRDRPVAEGVELLRALGARLEYVEEEGRLPVRVGGKMPRGGAIEVGRTASSQFISAILMLAPRLERGLDMKVSAESLTSPSYVELTLSAMEKWGIPVAVQRDSLGRIQRITVEPSAMEAQSVEVEPDASSAVYFLGAAAVTRDAKVTIRGLPRRSRQPDTACLAAFVSMGAREWSSPAGVSLEGTETLDGIDVDASRWPDGALCVAAVAALAKGKSRIRGLETLKVKESNRVQVLAEELTRLGCRVETTPSSLTIEPMAGSAKPVIIDPRGDHRIAMTFAVLGLGRPGISISNPQCVSKSYPRFWQDFALLSASGH